MEAKQFWGDDISVDRQEVTVPHSVFEGLANGYNNMLSQGADSNLPPEVLHTMASYSNPANYLNQHLTADKQSTFPVTRASVPIGLSRSSTSIAETLGMAPKAGKPVDNQRQGVMPGRLPSMLGLLKGEDPPNIEMPGVTVATTFQGHIDSNHHTGPHSIRSLLRAPEDMVMKATPDTTTNNLESGLNTKTSPDPQSHASMLLAGMHF